LDAALSVQLIERRSAAATLATWLWLLLMISAYLWQFSDYLRPILALFG
jgi:hypothetical protein